MSLATASADSCTREVEEPPRRLRRPKRSFPVTWTAFVAVNAAALLSVVLLMRVWQLGNLPGINGDEAEYAVRAVRLLRGEPIVWHTPTGNAVNPFLFFPQVAIHAVFAPSFTVLRLIAVASGLVALVLNYGLCRRLYGAETAQASTLLLAVLPIDIAYSRFAWDTCQTLAASTLVVYPALLMLGEPERRWRWFALACGGYATAYLVHPTNVFLGGFLVAVPLVERRSQWQAWLRNRGAWMSAALAIAAVAVAGIGSWLGRSAFSIGVVHTISPVTLGEFVRNYGRLFNGTTVYRYIAGSNGIETIVGDRWPLDFGWIDAATLAVFACSAIVLCRELRHAPRAADCGLLLGWLSTTLGFLLVAGPEALRPHWERYGLCLVLPGALLVARATSILWLERAAFGRTAALVGLTIAWFLVCDFGASYFAFIHRTGGESQETFRTASVEPKQAALDTVLAHRAANRTTRVVVGEWWNYWPLAYLASGQSDVFVVWNESEIANGTSASVHTAGATDLWFVDYAGSETHLRHRKVLVDERQGWHERFILDYARRPTLVLFAPNSLDLKHENAAASP